MLRLELIDVTMDPPPELQLPTPAPVTVQAVPVPIVPVAGFTSLGCGMQDIWCYLVLFLYKNLYVY